MPPSWSSTLLWSYIVFAVRCITSDCYFRHWWFPSLSDSFHYWWWPFSSVITAFIPFYISHHRQQLLRHILTPNPTILYTLQWVGALASTYWMLKLRTLIFVFLCCKLSFYNNRIVRSVCECICCMCALYKCWFTCLWRYGISEMCL
jgi:hypothetical protein